MLLFISVYLAPSVPLPFGFHPPGSFEVWNVPGDVIANVFSVRHRAWWGEKRAWVSSYYNKFFEKFHKDFLETNGNLMNDLFPNLVMEPSRKKKTHYQNDKFP